MYSAKERGKNNYKFFTESMNAEIVHRTTVVSELRKATERQEFVLHFQPIIDARTRAIVAMEALVRWRHPTRGLLPPGEFIEIAEESGLIVPIASQVLSAACRQNRAWQDQGLPPMRLAVNVSGVQLRHAGLCDTVVGVLCETELDAKYLELEITESAVMADEVEAGKNLAALKDLGLRIALDDFGTGYSSLSYVRRYPVDSLKIDRSFVQGVATNPDAQAITTAIVAMAHGLDLKVVAEGVETEEQEKFLVALGCDELQGFRLGRPKPAEEITRILAERFELEIAHPRAQRDA
jgi:EAL domain-containing protein (putative c-di-GMP-specific phosphodiesterase class I)